MTRYIFILIFVFSGVYTNLQAQQILYASPNKIPQNSLVMVYIYCSGTHFTTSKPSLKFTKTGYEYIPTHQVVVLNDTVLRIELWTFSNEIQPGIYDIVINDSVDGTITKSEGLEIIGAPPKPKIVSISPDTCNRGDNITLRIVGKNTFFNASNVDIIAIYYQTEIVSTPNKIVYYNDTLMDVSFKLLSSYFGSCDFLYSGKKENFIKIYGALYIRPPSEPIYISHISEDSVARGKTCRFFIYGKKTSFTLLTSKSAVCLFGGVSACSNSFTVINDTLMDAEFTIPFNASGVLTLYLNIPTYGKMYLNNCLQVVQNPDMMPAVNSVSPDVALQNSWASITVNCKYTLLLLSNRTMAFLSRTGFPMLQADSVFILNDTVLRAVFWIPKTTEPGKWDFMISNVFDGVFTAASIMEIKKEIGIQDMKTVEQLHIWPNPTNGYINISMPQQTGNYNLQLIDSRGKLCFSSKFSTTVSQKSLTNYDLSFLVPGIYLISLSNGKSIFRSKLVIQ
jgi:hypothetical protein